LNILRLGRHRHGKTTRLNALVASSPRRPPQRFITIEDAAELRLQQPHVCRLENAAPTPRVACELDHRATWCATPC